MDEIATRVPTLWDLVDRLWDDASGRLPVVWTDGRAVPTIRVEEHLQGDHLVVRAELPGIDPERDVDISLADDRLTTTAQRQESSEASEGAGGAASSATAPSRARSWCRPAPTRPR